MKKMSFVALALAGIFCFTRPSLSLSAENSVVAPASQNEMSKETYEKFRKIMLEGTPDDLRKLINGGFDINSAYNGTTPLFKAIGNIPYAFGALTSQISPDNALEKVKIVLEAGANPNQESGSKLRILPLESAIHIPFKIHAYEKGFYDVLVDVIKSGIDNNYCIANFAKSCDAVTQEDLDLLKYKINQAYKIASQGVDGYVLKTVALLVENGADVNAKSSDGKPVIFSALVGTNSTNLEILKFLISIGADVNIRDAQGNTPLFYAFGNQEAVDILLAAGADKSLYNYSGMRYDEYTKRTKHSYVDADGSVKSEYLD